MFFKPTKESGKIVPLSEGARRMVQVGQKQHEAEILRISSSKGFLESLLVTKDGQVLMHGSKPPSKKHLAKKSNLIDDEPEKKKKEREAMRVLNANAEEQPPNISLDGYEECNHGCFHCCGTLPLFPTLPDGFVNTLVSLAEYFQHFHKSTAANIMAVTGALADLSAQLDTWQRASQAKTELRKGSGVWIEPAHLQRMIRQAENSNKKTPHQNLVKSLLSHLLGPDKYLETGAEKMDRRLLSAIAGFVNEKYPDLAQPVERYYRCINLNRGYLLKRKVEPPSENTSHKNSVSDNMKLISSSRGETLQPSRKQMSKSLPDTMEDPKIKRARMATEKSKENRESPAVSSSAISGSIRNIPMPITAIQSFNNLGRPMIASPSTLYQIASSNNVTQPMTPNTKNIGQTMISSSNNLGRPVISSSNNIGQPVISVSNNLSRPMTNKGQPVISSSTNLSRPMISGTNNTGQPMISSSTNLSRPMISGTNNIGHPVISSSNNLSRPMISGTNNFGPPTISSASNLGRPNLLSTINVGRPRIASTNNLGRPRFASANNVGHAVISGTNNLEHPVRSQSNAEYPMISCKLPSGDNVDIPVVSSSMLHDRNIGLPIMTSSEPGGNITSPQIFYVRHNNDIINSDNVPSVTLQPTVKTPMSAALSGKNVRTTQNMQNLIVQGNSVSIANSILTTSNASLQSGNHANRVNGFMPLTSVSSTRNSNMILINQQRGMVLPNSAPVVSSGPRFVNVQNAAVNLNSSSAGTSRSQHSYYTYLGPATKSTFQGKRLPQYTTSGTVKIKNESDDGHIEGAIDITLSP